MVVNTESNFDANDGINSQNEGETGKNSNNMAGAQCTGKQIDDTVLP